MKLKIQALKWVPMGRGEFEIAHILSKGSTLQNALERFLLISSAFSLITGNKTLEDIGTLDDPTWRA